MICFWGGTSSFLCCVGRASVNGRKGSSDMVIATVASISLCCFGVSNENTCLVWERAICASSPIFTFPLHIEFAWSLIRYVS